MLVVCVDDGPCVHCKKEASRLHLNAIYTVIEEYPTAKGPGWVLAEIKPARHICNGKLFIGKTGFDPARFRPILTPDISTLEDILKCPASPPTSLPSTPQRVPTTVPSVEVGHGRMRKGVGSVRS